MTVLQLIERETCGPVREDMPLEELNLDSLEFLSLILELNTETGKDLSYSQIAKLGTVGDIIREYA